QPRAAADRAATAPAYPLRTPRAPEAPGPGRGRRWPWPLSAPSPSTRSRPTRCATSPRPLPGARPNRDNESPDLSWPPSLPFVWSSNDPNLQEGARFQRALGRYRRYNAAMNAARYAELMDLLVRNDDAISFAVHGDGFASQDLEAKLDAYFAE